MHTHIHNVKNKVLKYVLKTVFVDRLQHGPSEIFLIGFFCGID